MILVGYCVQLVGALQDLEVLRPCQAHPKVASISKTILPTAHYSPHFASFVPPRHTYVKGLLSHSRWILDQICQRGTVPHEVVHTDEHYCPDITHPFESTTNI